jgi:mannose-1-phosphate guanylyltransferase
LANTDHYYALIMAGGGGTRLWPMSRQTRPKQVLPLVGESTMFEMAVQRLDPLFPPERIFVVTAQPMADQLRAQAPELPPENFIVEPLARNTAPAIGLAALHIAARDPQASMAVLTADHYIADTERFRAVLAAAQEVAADGHIVTLGIKPDHPSTGYGYIERGASDSVVGGFEVFEAEAFVEKPDRATAQTYLDGGLHSWNSGMFVWQIGRLMAEIEGQQPGLHKHLGQIGAALDAGSYETALADVWPAVERISVDYAIMEGAEDVRVIPVDIGWNDVGSWAALLEINGADQHGNVTLGQEPLLLDTRDTLVASDKLVAVIGLEDMIIVDTEDALLVCKRERAQDVREMVERLKKASQDELL